MPETLTHPASRTAQSGQPLNAASTLNILAYVHLRNIHASTGAGRVARQMTEHLAQRSDTNVHVLADPADHARIVPLVKGEWEHYQYHFLGSETSRQQAQWFLLNRPVAEKYWPSAQIVYCTAESFVPVKKARLAVTLHDAAYLETHAHAPDLNFTKQRLKWKFLYRKLVRHADLFHTVSQFSADRLTHFLPEIRNRVRVVPNAVTPHFFEPVSTAGVAYLSSVGLSQKPFVLVPGGLHFRKNAELILTAWPLLKSMNPELTLAVVNHSNPAYVERAKAFGDSVQILGFVSDDALRALYSAAQLVWFPSRYEGFGLPVVEAMACGAAVVASDASSLPEIAGDAALLADATQPDVHVEAISSVLRNRSLQETLQSRGLARAQQFTWSESASQLKTYFEEIL